MNSQVDMNSFFTDLALDNARRAAPDSLLAKWMEGRPGHEAEILQRALPNICEGWQRVATNDNLRNQHYKCTAVVGALAVKYGINVQDYFRPEHLMILAYLSEDRSQAKQPPRGISPKQLRIMIDFFPKVHSFLAPLSGSKLVELARPCLDNAPFNCRSEVAASLQKTGFHDLVRSF